VKLIDLNLLLYAHHAAAKDHEPALAWLTQLFPVKNLLDSLG
jgi:predicted nucleic acid-binding protein